MPVFKPPIGVVNNAKKAIEWREKYPKETSSAGTQVGWVRARQLANGESVSEDIIGRMVSFFARHEGDEVVASEFKDEPWRDNGYLMWLAWGGDEGKTWSNKIYNQIQNNKSFNSMSQIEHKHIQLETKNFDKIKGTIIGYGVTYGNKDRVNDIILKGALNETIEDYKVGAEVMYLFEHEDKITLNSNLNDMNDDDIGLQIKAEPNEMARQMFPNQFNRIVEAFNRNKAFLSIGFFIKDAYVIRGGQKVYIYKDGIEIGRRLPEETRYLEKIKAREFSFTTNPANMEAKIIDLKNINLPKYPIDIENSWDGTQAEQRWREYTKSVEMPSTNYKNGFLYFDAENQDLFGSYHLQVVDIIDGEPKIIERAVFGVYQAMNGARNGLKVVPENEMPRLQGAVNELYTKINRVRVAEGMEALEMPNFKTKSEFDIALDSIKNRNIPNAKTNFERMLVKMKKEGKLSLSHYEIRKLVDTVVGTVCKAKLPTQEIEKILDNQNNDVNEQKSEPHLPEAHSHDNLIEEVKNQTFADAINAVAKNFKK